MIIFGLWLAKSSILLGAALLLSQLAKLSAATRHLVLFACVLAVPLLLLGEWLSPAALLPIAVPEFFLTWEAAPRTPAAAATSASVVASGTGFHIRWIMLLPALYLIVGMALLTIQIVRVWRTWQEVGRMPIDRRQPIPLRINRRGTSPFAWGIGERCIAVPSDWSGWNDSKQRSVLLHEQAHLDRGDALSALLSYGICCVFWFHPLLWMAHARTGLLAEQACDDKVIQHGIDTTHYAQHLLEISRMRAQKLAPSMARFSQLSRRIHVLLDPSTRRRPMTVSKSILILLLTSTSTIAILQVGLVRTAQAQTQNIRPDLVNQLTAVQVHIEDEAYADARRSLRSAQATAQLNDNEKAQIANIAGYLSFREGDYAQAITDYRSVIASTAIPDGLRQTTLYTLAQLHFVEGQYQGAIEYMQRWMQHAPDPGHIPKVFIAQTYYELGQYDAALESLDAALTQAQARGAKINPNWQKLHAHLQAIDRGAPTPAPQHSGVDGEYFPIAKVAPNYPRAAKQHGIEGYVIVEFTVGVDGSTHDHRVVEAQPPEIFDRAAVTAVARFKYKPRMVAGQAAPVPGVRNRINFSLDDDR